MRILFLCTGNACRSQMAEAWTRALKGNDIEALSAGTDPKGLDPRAVQVMAEADVDLSMHRSKHVRDILSDPGTPPLDAVVTVCDSAREACPVFPGEARVIHRGFPDPPALAHGLDETAALNCYREVRDRIRRFIEELPGSLEDGWEEPR